MLPRNNAGSFAQPFRAEYFSADWPDKLLSRSILGAAEETPQNFGVRLRWDYSRHGSLSTPKICRVDRNHSVKATQLIRSETKTYRRRLIPGLRASSRMPRIARP